MSKKKKMQAEQERLAKLQAEAVYSEQVNAGAPTAKEERPVAMEEYYNISYAQEKKRLNEMFGRISFGGFGEPEKEIVEKIVYKDPDLSNYVEKKVFKRKKRALGWITFFFILSFLACVAFALAHFNIITLPF